MIRVDFDLAEESAYAVIDAAEAIDNTLSGKCDWAEWVEGEASSQVAELRRSVLELREASIRQQRW